MVWFIDLKKIIHKNQLLWLWSGAWFLGLWKSQNNLNQTLFDSIKWITLDFFTCLLGPRGPLRLPLSGHCRYCSKSNSKSNNIVFCPQQIIKRKNDKRVQWQNDHLNDYIKSLGGKDEKDEKGHVVLVHDITYNWDAIFHVVLPLKYMFLFGLEPIKVRIREKWSMYFPDKIMRWFSNSCFLHLLHWFLPLSSWPTWRWTRWLTRWPTWRPTETSREPFYLKIAYGTLLQEPNDVLRAIE